MNRHTGSATALRESEARFREIADAAPVLIWMADTDNKGIWYNKAWLEFTGRSMEQELGDGWLEAVHPDDHARCAEICGGSVQLRKPFRLDFRLCRADGEWRVVDDIGVPRFAEDGTFSGYIGSCIDVTDARSSEKALREQAEELQTILDAVPAVIWIARDPDCTDIGGNIRARELLKMPDGAQMSKSASDAPSHFRIFGPDGTELAPDQLPVQRAARGENVRDFEERIEFDDGSSVDLIGNAVPLSDSGGKLRGAVAAFVDVTDRKRSEALHAAQNDVLELALADRPLEQTLEALVRAVEEQSSTGVKGSVLLLDEDGRHLRHGAASSLPQAYNHAIDGIEIGPGAGSCGTAAHSCKPVYVSDIANDPLWKDFRDLALSHGLRACWSIPILSGTGEVLGTFAMYHNEPRQPEPKDLDLVEFVTRTAALVIERKRAESAVRQSEKRFRSVFENAGIGLIEIDSEWRILGANAAYAQIAGRSTEELIGMDCLDFTHPDDIDRSVEAMRSLSEGHSERTNLEKRYLKPDGEAVWVRSNLSRISRGPGGDRFVKIVEDIDARKATEEALREERYRLETLNRAWAAVAAELDLEKLVQLVTDAGVELTGAEFGAFFYNVIDGSGESYMLYTLSGAEPSQFNFGMPRNTAVFAPTFEGTETVRSDDITKDPRYGKNSPHNGMPKGHLPVCSYLAVPVTGRSGEVIGGLFFGHSEPGQFTEAHERLLVGIAAQAAIGIDNARLYQAVQSANETLEEKVEERTAELETANEALRQAQKMEAIGQLTGGIAHDFNNMLTVIRGSADVLQRPDLEEEKRRKYLQAIAETSDRAARLTSQLLAFARRQALKPEVFDAAECIEKLGDILHTVLGARIGLKIEVECDDCFVDTDAAQFETALVNMAVNARDAMDGEGELRIRIERPAELPPALEGQSDGGYVAVSVADTGHGIAADDVEKIFEPFFTTKETGKGTGLGLSQVYGFIKQSDGEILVESEVGRGTTFTLFLPSAPEGSADSDGDEARPQQVPKGGRILVVEDNEEVGGFAEQVLGELGFEAHLVDGADEALALLDKDDGFDLVFSDVVMPGMGGIDLARAIRAKWPDLPVVLTSGYSHVLAGRADFGFPLLHKPYSLEALAKVLGTALAQSETAPQA